MDLAELYKEEINSSCNPLCSGCSILTLSKPFHCHPDYEFLQQSDILVLMDSFKTSRGDISPFKPLEKAIIDKHITYPYVVSASVKCPSITEAGMSTKDRDICRQHLELTIDRVKPKLVFACGNLAFKMLTKKSGVQSKRGKSFNAISKEGHNYVVVPIYHPFLVYKEPKHEQLFSSDISNAIAKHIHGTKAESSITQTFIVTREQLELARAALTNITEPISCDIETTGFNFLTDIIHTVAISQKDMTWVFPVDHRDSPLINIRNEILDCLVEILESTKNIKIFHNAKFDMKFFIRYNIYPINVWDTKLMYHCINENNPNALKDLVQNYFPLELEIF